jgi:hypothetical protein
VREVVRDSGDGDPEAGDSGWRCCCGRVQWECGDDGGHRVGERRRTVPAWNAAAGAGAWRRFFRPAGLKEVGRDGSGVEFGGRAGGGGT